MRHGHGVLLQTKRRRTMTITLPIHRAPTYDSDANLVLKGVTPEELAEAILNSPGSQKYKLYKLLKEAMPPF